MGKFDDAVRKVSHGKSVSMSKAKLRQPSFYEQRKVRKDSQSHHKEHCTLRRFQKGLYQTFADQTACMIHKLFQRTEEKSTFL